ncbi:4'-phosphopantetheinyl transferase family protein [Streptomyces sp. NRRL F-5123]|uniref:4'-phosphopantetheinyl transferase family protein n=1 Tax=Streptomyces sp. NRRL F-5123 TaxID=1463856 RepID=UPI00069480EE|nr:4'-phosphopantetheinyl transferase superfamily protein [Streptomyces sp. NRRL F-5123]
MAALPAVPAGAAAGLHVAWRPVRRPYGPQEQSAAGRRAAAAALAAAGSAERTVPRGPGGGRPGFPPGFAGSISHCDRLAVAAVVPGAAAVGVDIESAEIGPRMARFVLRTRERNMLLAPAGEYAARELFSAKEAAFKALSGIAGLGDFLFWRIELARSGDALTASYRDAAVPVWIRSTEELSFAVAVLR